MGIVQVTSENAKFWAELCNELWPDHSVDEMLADFNNGEYKNEYLYFIDDIPAAFLSLSIRKDYVEGKTDENPVGYLEGIYVKPQYRKQGIAKMLVQYAKEWSADRGCTMLASDCELVNKESRLFHNKVGFHEANINVHFAMHITK